MRRMTGGQSTGGSDGGFPKVPQGLVPEDNFGIPLDALDGTNGFRQGGVAGVLPR